MPLYEYRCNKCHKRSTILIRSFSAAEGLAVNCPFCGSRDLKRLVSRVAVLRSEDSRLESLADESMLSGLDENDPSSIARWMRKMGKESGEDLGDEFGEVVDRLEAGQSPDEIESAMPDLEAPPDGI